MAHKEIRPGAREAVPRGVTGRRRRARRAEYSILFIFRSEGCAISSGRHPYWRCFSLVRSDVVSFWGGGPRSGCGGGGV